MVDKQEKLSVIVALYNSEGFLDRCLMSLVRQTYGNLEIILVDDGSTDRSGEICDRYAAEYSNIQVIHKENGGVSDARNVGVEQATGKYVTFLDSDDYIHHQAYEIMLHHMELLGADIVECEYWKVWDQQDEREYLGCAVEVQTRDQAMIQHMEWKNFDISLWNKIYKREMFQNVRFPVGKIFEDEACTYKLLFQAKKLIHLFFPLYFYQQSRTTSILGGKFTEAQYASTEALLERIEFMKKNAPHLVEEANRAFVVHIFYHLHNFACSDKKVATYNKKFFCYYAKLLRDLPKTVQESYIATADRKQKQRLYVSKALAKLNIKLYWHTYRTIKKIKR